MTITKPTVGSTDWSYATDAAIDWINDHDTIDATIAAKQDGDADLTAIAGLTPTNDDIMQRKSGNWVNRTITQLITDLTSGLSALFQPLDSDLTAIASQTATTNNFLVSVSSAWASRTPAQAKTALAIAVADVSGAAPLASPTFTGTVTTASATLSGQVVETVVALTDAATILVNAALGNVFSVTLAGNRTLDAPSNAVNGQKILFRVRQDGTGTRTLAYNAIYRFSTDIPSPTLTTAINKTDYLGFVYNSTDTKWDCIGVVKGF